MMQIQLFLRLVRFSHTIFALPFALVGVALIFDAGQISLTWLDIVWIVIAFTGMRSFAMAFNRLADAAIDERNPRTQGREIPAGKLSKTQVWFFLALSLIAVWVSAWLLSPLAFYLSFPAIVLLAGYSYAKRFTFLVHLWLGIAIGMAPLGVYIALSGSLPLVSWILFITLATYISGFDILYALQDEEFDRSEKLHSIPAVLGTQGALVFSLVLHTITIAGFFTLYFYSPLSLPYLLGALVLSLLVIGEHVVVGWGKNVKKDKIPVAFFNFNSAVSILFFVFVLVDVLWRHFV